MEKVLPFQNNFMDYLRANNKSDFEIETILEKLELFLRKTDETSAQYQAVLYALDSCKPVHKYSKREERKLQCLNLYNQLQKTKMKRSEIVKTIAHKMQLNTDCIQVYLREIFSNT